MSEPYLNSYFDSIIAFLFDKPLYRPQKVDLHHTLGRVAHDSNHIDQRIKPLCNPSLHYVVTHVIIVACPHPLQLSCCIYILPDPLSCCIYTSEHVLLHIYCPHPAYILPSSRIYTALIPCGAAYILPSSPVLLHIYCPHTLCCCIYTALVSLLFGTVIPTFSCFYSLVEKAVPCTIYAAAVCVVKDEWTFTNR